MKAKVMNKRSIILPFIIGIVLGWVAKLMDAREIAFILPIFTDLFARFGIWIWIATLISIYSKTPKLAAVRSFVFFVGLLFSYYLYTVLFLGFFPKSQIVLWSIIALFSLPCGFVMWHARTKKWFANVLASFPLIIFFSEWYLTGKDDLPLLIIYLLMTFSYLSILQSIQKRLFSLLLAILVAVILIVLIRVGIAVNIYDKLLNI